MRLTLVVLIIMATIFTSACKKTEDTEPTVETSVPEIVSLTSDKVEIKFGGETATLICDATGGDMSYLWEVDLGDIFTINDDGSQVTFTGSACCIGEKIITCTASNDKGSVSQTVNVIIVP